MHITDERLMDLQKAIQAVLQMDPLSIVFRALQWIVCEAFIVSIRCGMYSHQYYQLADILSLLQTLATQLLADPQTDGTIIMTSPHSAPDPRHCLTANTLQPSAMFFSEPACLLSEVRKLLSLAVEQDEEEILRIVNTVCEVLKDAPLGGDHRELAATAGKQDEEVLFPGAAVTVVSCREDPGCLSAGLVNRIIFFFFFTIEVRHIRAMNMTNYVACLAQRITEVLVKKYSQGMLSKTE